MEIDNNTCNVEWTHVVYRYIVLEIKKIDNQL